MATSMLGYEGAIRGTKKDGATKQVKLYCTQQLLILLASYRGCYFTE